VLWDDPDARDAPVVYLAFHGTPGAVEAALGPIGPADLCRAFAGAGGQDRLIYFGACRVLRGRAGRRFARALLAASGARAVIGYTEDVDWMDGTAADLLFLHRFYASEDPWGALPRVFASVRRDFRPVREMGYTLVRGPG
jgi:hypothetical protein